MLKQEIIEKITKYFKLTHYDAEKIYDDIFQSIMKGVKDDNIAEISNLGEFILKYNENENSGFKKTVEFLPSANLEDEVGGVHEIKQDIENENVTEEKIQDIKSEIEPVIEPEKTVEEITPGKIEEEKPSMKEPIVQTTEKKDEPVSKSPEITEEHPIESTLSIEDEIKRKREQIIHKLDPEHHEKYHPLLHVSEGINLNVPKPIVIKEHEFTAKEKTEKPKIEIPEIKAEVKKAEEIIKEEIKDAKEEVKDEVSKEKEAVEEQTTKSFSDYFTEVKEEQKTKKEPAYIPPEEKVILPLEAIIPPVAVNLHKEIVGERTIKPPEPPISYQTTETETTAPLVKQKGNGYSSEAEKKVSDNSYYIWYKDSEPNAIDTQTMSYEYELLYQATKEAEYKSKLRIYVTTFILFFSIVLILLIFSPVFYKYFFTPSEEQTNEQTVPEEQSTTTPDNNITTVTPPVQNTAPAQEKATEPPPATNEQQSIQQNTQPKQEQKTNVPPPVTTTEQNTQKEPPATQQQNTTTPNVSGVVKTGLGWMDEKNKVIYVQLENGKFTIQESAWDSNDKANKRINAVAAYNISGLAGNVFKVDLGAKGTWFRARFGEFATIEEAKNKAEELRNKEKMKLQAFLLSIFLFT